MRANNVNILKIMRTICKNSCNFARIACEKQQQIIHNNNTDMSIDTYKLTSMDEPTDEVLSQLMREAAEEARETNAQATQRYFDELRQAAANIR